jgi:hypothetical protein
MRSYLDPDLDPLQRVEFAFYAMFSIEAWYTDLKEKDLIIKEKARIEAAIEKSKVQSANNWTAKKYAEWKKQNNKEAKEAKHKAKEEEKKRKAEEKVATRKKAKADSATTPAIPSEASVLLPPPPVLTEQPVQQRPTVAMQFITRTAAAGISFNAWFLFAFLHTLAQSEDLRVLIPFATRLLTEQAAEKIFRAARAVLGGENFTLADFFRRCDRFMAYNILRAQHDGVDFVFPEHESTWKWDEMVTSDKADHSLPASVTTAGAIGAIMNAKLACIADTLSVGIDVHKFKAVLHLDVDGNLDELEQDEDEDQNKAASDVFVAPAAELHSDLLRIAESTTVRLRSVYSSSFFKY